MNKILNSIKSFLLPTGEEKRINKIKEIRQQIIVLIMVTSLAFSIVVPLLILKKSGLIMTEISPEYNKNIGIIFLDKKITVPYINQFMSRLEEVKEKIKDGSFSHLIIVASSPGGSPQASDELAKYLLTYQEEVPVTFYVQSVCASGCYYIAASMKKIDDNNLSGIIANTNSVVGSIGVVMPHLVYGPALEKLGVKNEYIVEGEHKVPIDSWSLASEESKQYLKSNLLKPVYQSFQNFVKKYRKLGDAQMEKLNGGRVFVATLVEGTLVDRISYLQEIKKEIKTQIEKKYPNSSVGFVSIGVEPIRRNIFSSLFNIESLNIDVDELYPIANQLNSMNMK